MGELPGGDTTVRRRRGANTWSRPGLPGDPAALGRRTIFRWIMMHRRLARDYETKPEHSEAMIRLAAIDNLARRNRRKHHNRAQFMNYHSTTRDVL
jgi:transposase